MGIYENYDNAVRQITGLNLELRELRLEVRDKDREIERLRAENERLREGGERLQRWQPIETLPECQDALVAVRYNVGGPGDEDETVMWVDAWLGKDHGWFVYPHLIHVPFPPTHWMPLPAPPTDSRNSPEAPDTADSKSGSVSDG